MIPLYEGFKIHSKVEMKIQGQNNGKTESELKGYWEGGILGLWVREQDTLVMYPLHCVVQVLVLCIKNIINNSIANHNRYFSPPLT